MKCSQTKAKVHTVYFKHTKKEIGPSGHLTPMLFSVAGERPRVGIDPWTTSPHTHQAPRMVARQTLSIPTLKHVPPKIPGPRLMCNALLTMRMVPIRVTTAHLQQLWSAVALASHATKPHPLNLASTLSPGMQHFARLKTSLGFPFTLTTRTHSQSATLKILSSYISAYSKPFQKPRRPY